MQEKDIKDLLDRFHAGTATEEEKAFVESWYLQHREEGVNEYTLEERLHDAAAVWAALQQAEKQPARLVLWRRMAAAAAVLIFLSAGLYIYLAGTHHSPLTDHSYANDIAPGGNKAVLRSRGKVFNVSTAGNGVLAQQGNTTISKTADGQLVYNNIAGTSHVAVVYDTLIIPRGGQYRLKLGDGSIAYLNADTKIRYPENFAGDDRTVELISGEADFQVVHNAKKPFKVRVRNQVTEDIGTEFNISAYADEPLVRTTLLEGSVKISKNNHSAILKPGQQATTGAASENIKVTNVDTEEAFAWKNGYFMFNHESLQSVMQRIARWYDVDIQYPPGSKITENYWGSAPRYGNVSRVLHVLEVTGDVRFKIEGKKIIVLKK